MPEAPQSSNQDLPHDFSPVLGGPVFQLLRTSHLSGAALELLPRRMIVIPMIAWLPLLLLDLSSGSAGGLSFLHDVEAHVRFLVALPVLIAAELIVHLRTRPVVHRFVKRRIVLPDDLPRFDRAIESGIRLRNSIPLELGLVVVVYTLGLWLWSRRIAIQSPTWYAMPGGRWNLTDAGYWYVFVSIPIVQFVLLRWYTRFFIWYRFLWQVSRIHLKLIPTFPDRCGGLSFLGRSAYAFGPVLFAQGAMLAGVIASRVLYGGENLLTFKLEIVGFIAFFVCAVLTPLLMFTPQMARAKRKGLADYGQLAQDYVDSFDQKWIVRAPASVDDLLGTPDIQSLADLGNSYSIVGSMRAVPFGLNDITRLAVITAAPFFPLLLTIFSLEELVIRLIKALF
ncbi:MAG: hypothetical protein WB561_12930 [Terracidiphilus sp.]